MSEDVIPRSDEESLWQKISRPVRGTQMTISLFKQKTLKNIRALRLVVPDETGNGDFLVLRAERQIITPVAQRDALQDDFLPIQ